MKNYSLLLVLVFLVTHMSAQTDCEVADCACILKKANAAFSAQKHEEAIPLFQAYKVCQSGAAFYADSMVLQAFRAIEKEKRRAYANDLAYKSEIALRDGDRTTAYRLAELAYRYVDSDNMRVMQNIVNALYDSNRPTIPWSLNRFEVYRNWATSIALSPSGHLLALAQNDSIVYWDWEKSKITNIFKCHVERITHIAFSPDGKYLAAGNAEGVIILLSTDSGEIIQVLEGHRAPIDLIFFSPEKEYVVVISSDHTVRIWDRKNATTVLKLEGGLFAYSPEKNYLGFIRRDDDSVRILDIKTLKTIQMFEQFQPGVSDMVFSPDGKYLCLSSASFETTHIYSLESKKKVQEISGYTGDDCFSPGGNHFFTIKGTTVQIWDDMLDLKMEVKCADHVAFAAFSPDGTRLITVDWSQTVQVWAIDVERMNLWQGIGSHMNSSKVSFSPDGKYFAAQSLNGTFGLLDLASDSLMQFAGDECAAFSPDGKWLATGAIDSVRIWDLSDFSLKMVLAHGARDIAFSQKGNLMAISSTEGIVVWDVLTLESTLTKNATDQPLTAAAFWAFDHGYNYADHLLFFPNGKRIVFTIGDTVKFWDIDIALNRRAAPKKVPQIFTIEKELTNITLSSNGKLLAITTATGIGKIWELESGAVTTILSRDVESSAYCAAFFPNNRFLAIGYDDGKAFIWEIESGQAIFGLNNHNLMDNAVTKIAFSPDGRMLATGSFVDPHIWRLAPPDRSHQICKSISDIGVLTAKQLSDYHLEGLLEQKPSNTDSLIASHDIRQITAFAQLFAAYFYKIKNIKKNESLWESARKAERLYLEAIKLDAQPELLTQLGNLYQQWAEALLLSKWPDSAGRYIERACSMSRNKRACPDLWFRFSEKTGQKFNFEQFLASEASDELQAYGDYFFEHEKWEAARQLYEKAERRQHSSENIIKLFEISEEIGDPFDFNRFLGSEYFFELQLYGDYFYDHEKWDVARQLYEKSALKHHAPRLLRKLFLISRIIGEPFDFDRILTSENAWELQDQGAFFLTIEEWSKAQQLYEKAEQKQHSSENIEKLFEISGQTSGSFDCNRFLNSRAVWELNQYAEFINNNLSLPLQDSETLLEGINQYPCLLQIRSKQMQLDTTALLRRTVSREYINLSRLQLYESGGVETEQSCRRALELDPENRDAHLILPFAILQQGRMEEAKAYFLLWADKPRDKYSTRTYRYVYLDSLIDTDGNGIPGINIEQVKTWLIK